MTNPLHLKSGGMIKHVTFHGAQALIKVWNGRKQFNKKIGNIPRSLFPPLSSSELPLERKQIAELID